MSLNGKVRTANIQENKPEWTKSMKKRSVPITCTIDGEVSEVLSKKVRFIKFRYGSISQYINYLLAKDLGLVEEEEKNAEKHSAD
jgi:hypothetical protein